MKRYRLLEGKAGMTVLALFLLFQLLLARDSLVTTSILGFTRAQLLLAGGTALLGAAFLARNLGAWRKIVSDRRMGLAAAAAAILALPCLLKRDWQLMYFSILFCILLGVFMTYIASLEQVSRVYAALMAVLGAYSILATYFLRGIAQTGAVPFFYNSTEVKFYNFGLAFVSESYVKNRNFGIFREPGVYQYFILLALYLNQEHAHWSKAWVRPLISGVLALTMLTTLATGGVLELGLFAVFLFFDKKRYRKKAAWVVVILLLALLAGALAVIIAQRGELYWELYGMTVSKFLPGQESAVDRVQALWVDIALFLDHPILGASIVQVLHAMQNNTSSTLILFAILGLAGGCLHVAGWVALVWRRERNVFGNLALLAILFMAFNTQNLTADVFFWLFPTMALVERLMGEGKEEDKWNRQC